jgi:hypothetical protein
MAEGGVLANEDMIHKRVRPPSFKFEHTFEPGLHFLWDASVCPIVCSSV